ncbi:MAG: polymer-forming cytoskeletal protein [Patescibacteria group bacterium]
MSKSGGGETIVAKGVKVEGDFAVEGNIIIEGEVRGTINATGDLSVGEEAKVDADIRAENAVIAGDVRGNMRINAKLDMLPSSKFTGDLAAEVLSIGAGAQINGTVRMGAEEPVKPARGKRAAPAAVAEDDTE